MKMDFKIANRLTSDPACSCCAIPFLRSVPGNLSPAHKSVAKTTVVTTSAGPDELPILINTSKLELIYALVGDLV